MSFLDRFRRKQPEEVLRDIRHRVVTSALLFRTTLEEKSNERSMNAGAELLFLLLHLIDIAMFERLSAERRAIYFDTLALSAIHDYVIATMKQDTPELVRTKLSEILLARLNSRQTTYARCRSLIGDDFPAAGSKLFAMSFFIFRALGKTDRTTADWILSGQASLAESDLKDFPSIEIVLAHASYFTSAIREININGQVRQLR